MYVSYCPTSSRFRLWLLERDSRSNPSPHPYPLHIPQMQKVSASSSNSNITVAVESWWQIQCYQYGYQTDCYILLWYDVMIRIGFKLEKFQVKERNGQRSQTSSLCSFAKFAEEKKQKSGSIAIAMPKARLCKKGRKEEESIASLSLNVWMLS